MSNKNIKKNNILKATSLKGRIAEKDNSKKSNQEISKDFFEVEKENAQRIKDLMNVYRYSLKKSSWNDSEYLLFQAEKLISLVREYKANNKRDFLDGMFKTHFINLFNEVTKPQKNEEKIISHLNEINKEMRDCIKKEIEPFGLSVERETYKEVHHDYQRIARLDFDSRLTEVSEKDLSLDYKNAIKNKSNQPETYSDNGLTQISETWSRFAEFPNFKNIENKVFAELKKKNIPESVIATMTIKDFEDVLYKSNVKEYGSKKVCHLFKGDDARCQFVKSLVDSDEKTEAFKTAMKNKGVNPEYTSALIEVMQTKGIMNPGTVKNDLGEVVPPPDFTLTIHHKRAIKDMGALDDKSQINDLSNFVMVIDKPYHQPICHGLELPDYRTAPDGTFYAERLQFAEGLTIMLGLDKSLQVVSKEHAQKKAKRKYSHSCNWHLLGRLW